MNKIKKIVHCADIHVRTFALHDLYKKQFTEFIERLKEHLNGYNKDEIRIVIAGDITHQKINISNEQILLISWFFTELTKLGKLVIIPGNHDFLENNMQRVDSITPIVELLNNPDIQYYKDSGVYTDSNVKWVVYSLYQHNARPDFEKTNRHKYIGLFHGPVYGLSTDKGFKFEDTYEISLFAGLDLLLCGDIHKRQAFYIPNNKMGYMIGSLIQQDFAETVKNHGFGLYDVEKDEYTFHDLFNEQPYYNFEITDINDIENETERLLNIG